MFDAPLLSRRPLYALRLMTSLVCLLLIASPATLLAQQDGADASPKKERGSVRVTKKPVLVESVQADYPQEALDARVEGPVKLKLTIDASGKVTKAEVLESPGAGLGEAAQEAVEQFKFEPAEINGQPAAIILTFTINFQLPVLPSKFAGEVVDPTTGEGLEGAEVTITYQDTEGEFDDPPSATTTTDEEGSFYFGDVPAGMYDVRLRLDAYRDYQTTIELVAGERSEATYEIEAQPVNYIGEVREAGTRKLLPGVIVEMIEVSDKPARDVRISRRGFTDAEGAFRFRGVPPGKYRVLLNAEGYDSSVFVETITANERLDADYFLKAKYYDEYTVTTRANRERREVNRQTLTLKESRRIPGTGGDVVRVVQNLPGVARAPFGAGLLVVRGSSPGDSAVFLKGDELPIVYHFLAGPAVINSEMIQSIDFYPGNFSPRYGRAIGGIINLETRSPRNDIAHGFAEVDIQDASALFEVPLGEDWSFALSGRRSYVDVVLDAVVPEDALGFRVAPYYYDYQSWLTYRGLDDHLFELFIYGSRDELRVLFDEPQGSSDFQLTSISQETEFHRGQLRWEWRPSQEVENIFMGSFGLIRTGFSAGGFGAGTDLWTSNIRNDLRLKLSDNITVRTGVDMQFAFSDFDLNVPVIGQSDAGDGPNPVAGGLLDAGDVSLSYPAFYAEAETKLLEDLTLTPGIRVDHYSNTGNTTFSPRLTARYAITDEVAAKGGVGLFDQPPSPFNTLDGLGNPDLRSEKALHYALGGEWRPLEYLEFDTTLFFRDSYDLVNTTSETRVNEETGQPEPVLFLNEGEGRSYGAEILLRHYPNKRFFGWIAYTLSRSERLDLDTGEYRPFDFDQTHILTLVAGYNLPNNWDISTRFRLVTGNPFTPIVGSVFNAQEDAYEDVSGEPNSARNGTFNQLDIRVDKSFVYDRWILAVYLDVQNVYNASNPEGRLYNYDSTQSTSINGIPIFPNLGITAKF